MLLPKDISPEESLYYTGGFIFNIVKNYNEIEIIDLFYETQKDIQISISIFILSLDWLYLLDVIKFNKKGNLQLCL